MHKAQLTVRAASLELARDGDAMQLADEAGHQYQSDSLPHGEREDKLKIFFLA